VSKVLDQIRKAIRESETSRYRISKEIGISEAQLSRLMAGKSGLSIDSLEKICKSLNLEIVIQPKAKRRKKGKE
jgi:DNA-binding Xre family transcriptional regulator